MRSCPSSRTLGTERVYRWHHIFSRSLWTCPSITRVYISWRSLRWLCKPLGACARLPPFFTLQVLNAIYAIGGTHSPSSECGSCPNRHAACYSPPVSRRYAKWTPGNPSKPHHPVVPVQRLSHRLPSMRTRLRLRLRQGRRPHLLRDVLLPLDVAGAQQRRACHARGRAVRQYVSFPFQHPLAAHENADVQAGTTLGPASRE